ncbi:hypothetical protein [Schlesneria paludicola]|uniref:hypothetical protein n=1 Tax=Schlesneria paludicola TaxID=360056 RepID=UPI000299F28A|nr:hypothetical protein [Schlesneria paludicola]
MNASDSRTLIQFFDNDAAAQKAISELRAVGFSGAQIGLIRRDLDRKVDGLASGPSRTIGSMSGLPALDGLAPGIGPSTAVGILSVLFWSTVTIGAAGAMVSLGIPHEDAEHCEQEFKSGRTVLVVKAGTRADIAHSVLCRFERPHLIAAI